MRAADHLADDDVGSAFDNFDQQSVGTSEKDFEEFQKGLQEQLKILDSFSGAVDTYIDEGKDNSGRIQAQRKRLKTGSYSPKDRIGVVISSDEEDDNPPMQRIPDRKKKIISKIT